MKLRRSHHCYYYRVKYKFKSLTKPGAFWHWNCPNVFCALMNVVCDGVLYVWFYLGTTESMAERNIFSARSRFGFQGNVTKEMWSHVHMKRSRRHILMQHLRHITKMKNKIGNRCQNKQTAALMTWLQYYIVSSFESWKTSP